MPVDDEAGQMLQRRETLGLVDGPFQFEHHARVLHRLLQGLWQRGRRRRRRLLPHLPLLVFPLGSHVVLHQAGHVGKGREAGLGLRVGVEQELGPAVLDPYAGGAPGRPDREGQHVQRVAAVSYQKGPFGRLLERSMGLSRSHSPPVPTCEKSSVLFPLDRAATFLPKNPDGEKLKAKKKKEKGGSAEERLEPFVAFQESSLLS